MPDFVQQPRDSAVAQMTRAREPYAHQKDRQLFNRQPRPAQANTSQPNQVSARTGWGMSTSDYWHGVFEDYLRRNRLAKETSLRMGREL